MPQPCQRTRPTSLVDQIPILGQPGNCGLRDTDDNTRTLGTEDHVIQPIALVSSNNDDNSERQWRHVDYQMFMSSRAGRWGVDQQVSQGGLVSLIPMLKKAQTYTKTEVHSEKVLGLEPDSPHRLTMANLHAWTHARPRDDSPSYDSDTSDNSSRDIRRSRWLDLPSRQIQTASQCIPRDRKQQPSTPASATPSVQRQGDLPTGSQKRSM